MKKILTTLLCISMFCLLVLTGCGVEGSTTPRGIKFTKDVYYVDLNVNSFIDYKVYPSTVPSVDVSYSIDDDYTESRYYTFQNGWIKVNDKRFTGLNITVTLNDLTDSARVVLREYPQSVAFDAAFDYIFAGSYKTLRLQGVFADETRYCENGEFHYSVTSSDTSVIEVVDSASLLVKSTGRRGRSEITVKLINSDGTEVNLSTKITLIVEDKIEEVFATMGEDMTIKNNGNYTLITSIGTELKVNARYFNAEGYLIDISDYNVFSNNDEAVKVTVTDGKTYLEIVGEGTAKITLQSDGVMAAGLPCKLVFDITVQIS